MLLRGSLPCVPEGVACSLNPKKGSEHSESTRPPAPTCIRCCRGGVDEAARGLGGGVHVGQLALDELQQSSRCTEFC